ncbi:sodium-dependent transporter [Clostridium perfringens]|uniref:sodium-dependent transporter n=1 Tax=Clostridium perfringens TaxID=1502 RepID=UPI0021497A1B|nr:sodium-dependent transporter [Clostridium perfringens]MDM0916108.1 sodium-dependent transporter [Clostridium perfringens]UUR79735.1 sodium-dependent transporter [Clostridium perfringens]
MKERENFTGKFGFVISCVGAALGLGNIWLFSYRLGQYGGAAFLIPYFLFVFILGTTGLITEFSFGRKFKAGSYTGIVESFKSKSLKGGKFFGMLPPIGLTGVFIFYSIVVGWILKYFFLSLTGSINTIDTTTYFSNFAGTPNTIFWFALAIILTLIIVSLGIDRGIEKLNKIVMPLLLLIFLILIIRSLTLPGSFEGVKYLLVPRWENLFKIDTWVMALGQAFFTVSLNGCGMVVYGSYINDKFDIPSSAIQTAIFDTLAALLASFMIMPAVFAYGLNPSSGPSLLFITLPKIFQGMNLGSLLSTLFFLSVIFAAISSSVNMLEGPVEAFMAHFKSNRIKTSIIISVLCFLCGIPLLLNMGIFDNFSNLITIIISPLCALLVAVVFYYIIGGENVLIEVNKGAHKKLGKWFIPLGKYIFILVTILVIILGIIYGGIG